MHIREPLYMLLRHFAYERGLDMTQYLVSCAINEGLGRPRVLPYEVTLAMEKRTFTKEHRLVIQALKAAGPQSKRGRKGLEFTDPASALDTLEEVEAKLEQLEKSPPSK